MAYAHHERLSALDLSFLAMEDGRAHMHIGSVAIYDAEPLRAESGGLDFERILEFMEVQLHKFPRFRQRLEWVPGFAHPVWVDDSSFNLLYHVRHTSLPPPGDTRLLKRLAGRILSQEFDRGKPLWENWFVDGLEGGRFALISKLHHCIADGVTAGAMGNVLVGTDPDYKPAARREWMPRPAPTNTQLFLDELRHRIAAPWALLSGGAPGAPARGGEPSARGGEPSARGEEPSARGGEPSARGEEPSARGGVPSARGEVPAAQEKRAAERAALPFAGPGEALRGLIDGISSLSEGASSTPLNVPVGPHRRFDWARLSFADVHDVAARAGGKVNDVVLAVAAGALRSFLLKRGMMVDELEYRAIVPVSLRAGADKRDLGNRVSGLVARLPLEEADPWKRLLYLVEETRDLKSSGFSGAGALATQLIDLVPTQLLGPLIRRVSRSSAANIVITNVPGPQVPIYLLGARQLECYPVVPLASSQALGIALISYDGGLYWGLNADWDAVPDLHDLAESILSGFDDLRAAAIP